GQCVASIGEYGPDQVGGCLCECPGRVYDRAAVGKILVDKMREDVCFVATANYQSIHAIRVGGSPCARILRASGRYCTVSAANIERTKELYGLIISRWCVHDLF